MQKNPSIVYIPIFVNLSILHLVKVTNALSISLMKRVACYLLFHTHKRRGICRSQTAHGRYVTPIGRIKEISSDNGGEYIFQAFEKVLRDSGIKHTMMEYRTHHIKWEIGTQLERCNRNG